MSNNQTSGEEDEEDQIKAAVRDAARKTHERLAAYQEKQAAKAAAASVESEPKRPPSKGALHAESTVSRLQALVSESKRLTNKSKELFAATAAAAPPSEEKEFSHKLATINSHNKSIDQNIDSSTGKGKNLSDLFQSQVHNDGGSTQSQTASLDTSLSGSSSHSTRSRSSNTAKGKKLSALFQSLGSNQQTPDLNGSASSFMSMPFLDSNGKRMPKKNTGQLLSDNKASKEEGDRPNQHNIASLDGSGSNHSTNNRPGVDRGDSVHALLGPIMESGLIRQGSFIRYGTAAQKQQQKQVADQATKEQQEQERIILSLSVPDIDIDEDDDEIPEDDDDDNNDSGDFSIFNMVEEKKKKDATYNQKNGMDLPPEDIEELMEDYYSSSGGIFETPKMPNKPKVDVGVGSHKKKKRASGKSSDDGRHTHTKENATSENGEDDEVDGIPMDDLPPLEDILETPQIPIKAKAITSYDDYDDEMDSSMPMLAPFATPKGAKSKISPKVSKDIKKETTRSGRWSKKMVAINNNLSSQKKSDSPEKSETTTSPGVKNGKEQNNDPSAIIENNDVDIDATNNISSATAPASPEQYVEDVSMNLSQVFQQSLVMQDQAKSRPAENTSNSSNDKTTLRRPSLEHVQEGPENEDAVDDGSNKNASSSTKGSARRGREKEKGDKDGGSAKCSRSRSTSRKSTHRREKSVRGKRSTSVNKEEGGDSPENETKPKMDVSDLSADSSSGGGLGDGSDERSIDQSLSREGSMRRGRSMGENSLRQQRSRSARRSVSRSASMRRRRQTSKQEAVENQKAPDRRPSMSKRSESSDDGSTRDLRIRDSSVRRSRLRDSSVRDNNNNNNNSMRDASTRRRRSISSRRGPAKRSQRRGGDDKDANTADDILDSLDVSDIKLVGEDEEESNKNGSKAGLMEDHSAESRSSIYDRKPKRQLLPPNKSLAGLASLDPKDQGGSQPLEDACGESIAESIQSSVSKTSRMSKFAKKVGRRLTLKGSKKKKDSNEDAADLSNNESGNLDVDMDNELAALAAEFDKEEKEIERTSSFESHGDPAKEGDAGLVDPKSKKKRGMLGKIKKVGSKMTKKKKKKNKKNKESEALGSDSESEGDELLGSEYSGGTIDRSLESDEPDEDIDAQNEKFAQLQIDGDKASIAICGSESVDDMHNSSGRIRQRRASSVRQRADRQRNQSLQAVLCRSERTQVNDDSSLQCSVATTESKIRSRRSKSTRGRIQRISDAETGKNERGTPRHDVQRAKSLKGRIGGEANDNKMDKSSRRVRRTRSVETLSPKKNIQENESPAFNWETYTAEKDSAQTKKSKGRKKSTKAAEPKLTGGLSKLIYHHQAVAG